MSPPALLFMDRVESYLEPLSVTDRSESCLATIVSNNQVRSCLARLAYLCRAWRGIMKPLATHQKLLAFVSNLTLSS